MKSILIMLAVIFVSCANNIAQDKEKIIQFNKFLGDDKAFALDNLLFSFQEFLNKNYSSEEHLATKTRHFLRYLLKNDCEPLDSWKFNTKKNLKVFNAFEESGLRKEIYLYQYEIEAHEFLKQEYSIYDIIKETETEQTNNLNLGELDTVLFDIVIPIVELSKEDSIASMEREKEMQNRMDNALVFNLNGRFLYGLAKYGTDSTAYNYAEAIVTAGELSPLLIAMVFTNLSSRSLEDPFTQRIIVVELYYFLMRHDLKVHKQL